MRRAHDATAAATVQMTVDAEDAHGFSEAEFRLFYEQTARPLRAWLRRVTALEQADDIVQEAYLRVLRAQARDLPVDERRAYLYRVATNLVNDAWRAKQREGSPVAGLDVEDLTAPLTTPGDGIDVRRALSRLRLKERTLLWLAYVERASHREIASALEVKEGSVRVLLSRARQKLAGALQVGRGGGA